MVCYAIKKMNKRKYVHINGKSASLTTDGGAEFKGILARWLYDESIYHKITQPNRHTQMANMNYLTGQLGKIFNSYMNAIEKREQVKFIKIGRILLIKQE
jgi:hypothetical protein